jgi:precorrin-2/cobalt-factor-2 C20-methyltransferase
MSEPSLYGIGLGPGDPALLTVKAVEILERVDRIFVPKGSRKDNSLARSIVERALGNKPRLGNKPHLEELIFPMSRDPEVLQEHWGKAAGRVLECIDAGETVAFVTLGDPAVYSTYTYLLQNIQARRPALAVETVPGISVLNAAAAAFNLSLVSGPERLVVLPLPEELEDLDVLIPQFETLVLLKVGARLPELSRFLEGRGLAAQAFCAARIGLSGQWLRRGLDEADGPGSGAPGGLATVILRTTTTAGSCARKAHP